MIEVTDVSRHFGLFKAVDGVSFSIPTGQIVGLLGPNGAGKTTTMRMITGFLKPTSGTIKIDGIDVLEDPVAVKSRIGYMPESAPLYGDMIVEDYLNYIADIQGKDPAEKVPLLCKECGLEEVMHKNIAELSRGYRQRVGLAHALMNDRENPNGNHFHPYSWRSGNSLQPSDNHFRRKTCRRFSDRPA